jgi:hypothetical protein
VLEHLALNSGLFYALMAGMTAQLIGPSVPSDSNTDLMRNAAKLRIQAMGHLRTRLSQPLTLNDDGIIFTILMLALAEGILDNIPAFLIHRSQLRRLLKIRGSISNLMVDENTKAMIWRYVTAVPSPRCIANITVDLNLGVTRREPWTTARIIQHGRFLLSTTCEHRACRLDSNVSLSTMASPIALFR